MRKTKVEISLTFGLASKGKVWLLLFTSIVSEATSKIMQIQSDVNLQNDILTSELKKT